MLRCNMDNLMIVYIHREIRVTVDTPVSNAMSVVVLELLKSLPSMFIATTQTNKKHKRGKLNRTQLK